MKNGSNVISVTAKDRAGNTGTATLTVIYTPLDTDPPDTIITAGPAGIHTSNSATFTFTGSDNKTPASDLISTLLQGYDSGWSPFSSSISITFRSRQSISYPLGIGDYYPVSFSFEKSGDIDIEVTGPARMCIGLYSAANGRLLSYRNGLGEPKTLIKYPASESMAYHLLVTPCINDIKNWTFSINGPPSSGDMLHLNNNFRATTQGAINTIHDRGFYSVTPSLNAGRRLIATLLPNQNFNGLLRLFNDKGETLVASANNQEDGAVDVLTHVEVIPGQVYYICVEGYSANRHQGTGNYELRVEFVE